MESRATVLSGVDASWREVMSSAAAILIVGDDRDVRTSLAAYVGRHGYAVSTVSSTAGALEVLAERDVDIVLADLRMAGRGDLALLRDMRRRRPETVIVLMTAPTALAGTGVGFRVQPYDYRIEPQAPDRILTLLQRVLGTRALRRGIGAAVVGVEPPAFLESQNPAMRAALATARQAAASDAAVLLTGESGTGKDILAAAIHA
jgi:DNA-binding NtrC family response regulator